MRHVRTLLSSALQLQLFCIVVALASPPSAHARGDQPPSKAKMREIIEAHHTKLQREIFFTAATQLGIPIEQLSLTEPLLKSFRDGRMELQSARSSSKGKLDSLDYVELMLAFEDEFALPFFEPNHTPMKFDSLGDVLQHVLHNRHRLHNCIKDPGKAKHLVCKP